MTENNIIFGLLNELNLNEIICDINLIEFNNHVKSHYSNEILSFSYDDNSNQQIWFMPKSYKEINIEKYFEKFITEFNKERILLELNLYKKNNYYDLLRYLIFLVDVMKANNIIWGVGRGSSCASYLLYLIELHDVDCIKYDISIDDFLRSN